MATKRDTVRDGATTPTQAPASYPTHAPADETLEQLKAQFGTVYTIEAQDHAGHPLKMYLRKPDFNVRLKALAAIMAGTNPQDVNALVAAGQIVLAGCYVGGDQLLSHDDAVLEASMQAAELVEMNSTVQLKKN